MVCAVLMDYQITDVQIENNVQLTDEELNQMYADFVKELPEDDGSCAVTFYLDEKGYIPEGTGTGDSPSAANEAADYQGIFVDMEEVRAGLLEAVDLFGIRPVTIEESSVDTQDWKDKWKEYFHPFTVGNVMIHPSWEKPEMKDGQVVISIDPGMAFGTGTHETTRLCLLALQQYLKRGMRVLDLGTGSGILGIAACKLGASSVTAIDIDEQAVKVAEENFALNCGASCPSSDKDKAKHRAENEVCSSTDSEKGRMENGTQQYRLFTANIMQDLDVQEVLAGQPYDIVLANILADVIVPLSAFVHRFLKPEGVFIASGIIDDKEQDVISAIQAAPELELQQTMADKDWRAVIARRL